MKPASAEKLDKLGIAYRLIRLRDRAVTVQNVIDNAEGDLEPSEICKTIIVKDGKEAMFAVFLQGVDRIDFRKLKAVLGKASVASREEVLEVTGVEAGAVCPLTLDVPLYMDERVLGLERVNFGSGDHMYGIEVRTEDLLQVLGCRVIDAV